MSLLTGCGIESLIFPIFEPELFPNPPAALGPYGYSERRMDLDNLGDGAPGGVTIFEPVGTEGPRPMLLWVLGLNNRAHFHQSFHENMASYGYIEVVPDTRDLSFTDSQYHERNTRNAVHVYDLAVSGRLGLDVVAERTAFGGYSVGGSLAAFAAARRSAARALVMWAPSPAPLWQGLDPAAALPHVTQPSLFLLAELDDVTPADQWPAQMMSLMQQSQKTTEVISEGVHLYFQQPSGVDDRNPPTTLTRPEQMRQAIEITRAFLDSESAD